MLRHTYGTVTAISTDSTSITIDKDFPTLPAVSPETEITGTQTLTIQADATNGTLFYDVDAKTVATIDNFSGETSLDGKFVRIAARYQEDGTLVATRIWASSTFNSVWVSPEGHVLNVNANTDIVTVTNESGIGVPLTVNANTTVLLSPALEPGGRCHADRHRHRVPDQQEHRARLQGACQCRGSARRAAGGAGNRHRNRGLLGRDLGTRAPAASPTRTTSCAPSTTTP